MKHAFLILVFAITFFGCSKKSATASLAGEYYGADPKTRLGAQITFIKYRIKYGTHTYSAAMYLSLKSDSTFEMTNCSFRFTGSWTTTADSLSLLVLDSRYKVDSMNSVDSLTKYRQTGYVSKFKIDERRIYKVGDFMHKGRSYKWITMLRRKQNR